MAERVVALEPAVEAESCTIRQWRGYRSATFFASSDGETAILESRPFRGRATDTPPEGGAVRAAHDELVAALEDAGWARSSHESGPWYATRFVRHVARRQAVAAPTAPPQPLWEEAPPLWEDAPPPPEPAPIQASPPAVARPEIAPPEIAPPPEPAPRAVPPRPVEPPRNEPPQSGPPPVRSAPKAVPEPAPRPRSRRRLLRRPKLVAIVAAVGACVAVGALALGAAGFGANHTKTVLVKVPPPAAKPIRHVAERPVQPVSVQAVTTAPVTVKAVPSPPAPPANVKLAITATGGSSWLEVRRGSATGQVVYAGELQDGHSLHLHGTRLWARFGAAGHLTVAVDGRRLALTGTLERVFAPAKR
jgi:hypothetical protein